ncbi:Aste57867_8854 [Aphanomyces stellatus]|uniref:ATP-dependent DNA helicase n=1 Tax=Aphanomyces stellatus TaxID=120398 RepID=A0A485KLP1_9STRA|nr:hypothetical protein As57867_008819 [Aphanomyces stellatus]VFT85740.1 Aste57867_8854 [Aphanomyces stellatus]
MLAWANQIPGISNFQTHRSMESGDGGVRCDVEIQVALTSTGHNTRSALHRDALLVKRRGGLQVFAARVKTAIRTHGAEVYFSQVGRGKLTFIWRESTKYTQFNCHNGQPAAMLLLLQFALDQGAIAKTPMAVLKTTPSVAAVRPPLQDHTNTRTPAVASFASPPSRKRRHPTSSPPKARQLHAPAHHPAAKKTRQLTPEQSQVVQAILDRQNVFFTGRAGTGKSFLLRHIQRILPPAGLICTATTGIAAFHIQGMTLHHFAGLTPADKLHVPDMLASIRRKSDALLRWRQTRTLVIDEISMLGPNPHFNGRVFEALEAIARQLRQSRLFFGGIQLVLSGDFYQLPPVATDKAPAFCFEMDAWKRGITKSISLDQVFRQREAEFVTMLNAIRVGTFTSTMLAALNQRVNADMATHPTHAIHMFTHNTDVLEMNKTRLEALQGPAREYAAIDTYDHVVFCLPMARCRGKLDLLHGSPIPSRIQLKKGAKVMLTKTLAVSTGLVNGACGIVLGFTLDTKLPIVRFNHGPSQVIAFEVFSVCANQVPVASRQQLPLTLAYAISIHKSQGLTFDSAVLHLAKVFECGQAYVALSRLSSLGGLTLAAPLTRQAIRVHPRLQHAPL